MKSGIKLLAGMVGLLPSAQLAIAGKIDLSGPPTFEHYSRTSQDGRGRSGQVWVENIPSPGQNYLTCQATGWVVYPQASPQLREQQFAGDWQTVGGDAVRLFSCLAPCGIERYRVTCRRIKTPLDD